MMHEADTIPNRYMAPEEPMPTRWQNDTRWQQFEDRPLSLLEEQFLREFDERLRLRVAFYRLTGVMV